MLIGVAGLSLAVGARAGHEISYYPSFYPQEIRIEPLAPDVAAKELSENTLHAYVGAAPNFSGDVPGHLKSADSLQSFIVLSFNPQSGRVLGRDARCRAAARTLSTLRQQPDVILHPYPITPYHADYFGHIDLVPEAKPAEAAAQGNAPPLSFAAAADIEALLPPSATAPQGDWDARLEEVPMVDLLTNAGVGFNQWSPAPWAKEGWFQAYRLLRSAVSDPAEAASADEAYERLTHQLVNDQVQRINLERSLVGALSRGCNRAVLGHRVRREFYTDEFSNGVENIAVDSQFGFNSPVFVRTVKLKDFPWNGWLRLGINARPPAAWNPVAGFTDTAGRLIWSTVGDSAFLPIPYNSRWAPNRVALHEDDHPAPKQSTPIPADALMPSSTGALAPVGAGAYARGKLTYRVLASSFHDGTEMDAADLLYPYALAFRWSVKNANGNAFDPEIEAGTRLMRERLRGVRMIRVEDRTLKASDLTFTYRVPVVEIYLDALSADPSERQQSAVMAAPWSSVPWHLLALMEAAVERGMAAFSRAEAARRGVPWLDLVRVPVQRDKMAALVKEFAQTGYRPAAIAKLVTPEAARARWQSLDRFIAANGHLLVTNGPYRLTSWSDDAFVFQVVRDFTYPIGLGTFDFYAYPPRAVIGQIERAGNRILVSADVELALKEQRNRRIVRAALKRDTLRETFRMHPVPRYMVVASDGTVAAAGTPSWEADGRFVVPLPDALAAGHSTVFIAIFLDGNTINPAVGRVSVGND